jgi:hypothetical protein
MPDQEKTDTNADRKPVGIRANSQV